MRKHHNINPEDARLARKRKTIFFLTICLIALSWYVVTGIESLSMGLHPLVRRPFTWFDWLFYAVIIAGIFKSYFWYRKCPKCGQKMRPSGMSLHCPGCGFGNRPDSRST